MTISRCSTRHRAHARVEDRIRCGKDTGKPALPCDTFASHARNQLWLQLMLLAQDLLTFTQILGFDPGELRTAEPQQLRYKVLHTPPGSSATPESIRIGLPGRLALGRPDRGRVRPATCPARARTPLTTPSSPATTPPARPHWAAKVSHRDRNPTQHQPQPGTANP